MSWRDKCVGFSLGFGVFGILASVFCFGWRRFRFREVCRVLGSLGEFGYVYEVLVDIIFL